MKLFFSSAIILVFTIFTVFAQGQNNSSSELNAVIIGSGSPQYSAERAGPSVLIRYKNQNILVDTGNGSQANLDKLNLNFRRLDGIFITHHHLDHNEEFIPLFIRVLLSGNRFEIAGPPPTNQYISSVLSIYQKDIEYRLSRRNLDFLSVKNNFNIRELKGGETFSIGEIKISTIAVNHTIETVAYRFDAGGKSIVISGDLTYSESLSQLAKDADVLIIDSGAVVRKNGQNQNRPNGNRRPNQNGQRTGRQGQQNESRERAHSTLDEVGKMAKDANVKKLIMNHLPTAEIDEEATKVTVLRMYKGEILFAKDLMVIQTSN